MRILAALLFILVVVSGAAAQLRPFTPPVVPHPPIVVPPSASQRLNGNLNGSMPILSAPRLEGSFPQTAPAPTPANFPSNVSKTPGANYTPVAHPPMQVTPPAPPPREPFDGDGDSQRSNRGMPWVFWLVIAAVVLIVLFRKDARS